MPQLKEGRSDRIQKLQTNPRPENLHDRIQAERENQNENQLALAVSADCHQVLMLQNVKQELPDRLVCYQQEVHPEVCQSLCRPHAGLAAAVQLCSHMSGVCMSCPFRLW